MAVEHIWGLGIILYILEAQFTTGISRSLDNAQKKIIATLESQGRIGENPITVEDLIARNKLKGKINETRKQ